MSELTLAERERLRARCYELLRDGWRDCIFGAVDLEKLKALCDAADERDRLLEERRDSLSRWHNIAESEKQVTAQAATIEGLVEALTRYGDHDVQCRYASSPCRCGFTATIAAARKETP